MIMARKTVPLRQPDDEDERLIDWANARRLTIGNIISPCANVAANVVRFAARKTTLTERTRLIPCLKAGVSAA